MYEQTLKEMREKVRTRQYIMTLHAEDEMEDDELSIFDIESVILTGEIVERQKDQQPDQWKYILSGSCLSGKVACVVGRISITGKLVIITVFQGTIGEKP
jgi:hypothetical protein